MAVVPVPDRPLPVVRDGPPPLAEVLDRLPHAVLVLDADCMVRVANARALGVLDRGRSTVLGHSVWALLPGLEESTIGRCCRAVMLDGRPGAVEAELPGHPGWYRVHAVPGPDGGLVLHVRDVSAERRLADHVADLADHDVLTGIASRRHLAERLAAVVAHAAGNRAGDATAPDAAARGAAVLLLDLDGFAAVNAVRGHDGGDRLLRQVAHRLGRIARGADTVARVGADEFAILLGDVSADEATAVGERVLAALVAPGAPGDAEAGVTGCLGIVAIDGADDADTVLRDAGAALARARASGTGRLARFTVALRDEARARDQLAASLRAAVARLVDADDAGDFSLAFQPVVDLATGVPTGVEALLRWRDPALGAVSPATFVPLAEELGLIAPIGRWVLRAACAAIAGVGAVAPPAANGWSPAQLSVAVNVSGHQLENGGFADEVVAALDAAGLAPSRLTLEVTETALVRDPRRARRVLGEVRALGARIAIDDFGTGFSSLGYLHQLPLDVLKIDKRFIDGLAHGGGPSVAIPRAIVALGGALGLRTVAEGIETEAQRAALRALDCDRGQGYLFARPLPVAELEAWLDARPWERDGTSPG